MIHHSPITEWQNSDVGRSNGSCKGDVEVDQGVTEQVNIRKIGDVMATSKEVIIRPLERSKTELAKRGKTSSE